MSRPSPWKIAAAGVLTTGTLVLSATALASLLGASTPIGFAETYDKRAYALLTGPASPAALDSAASEASKALALSPYSNSARLRLTYIDTVRRGSLGPVGTAHLAKSYDLVPLDHTVAAWRVRFALEHWKELPPEARTAVETEARAFARTGSQDADVRAALGSIRSPEGRLAAALWLKTLAH